MTVLVRGVLEWACSDEVLREIFDQQCRPRQWDRKLNVSAITGLMLACTTEILFAIIDRWASLVIRQHTQLRWRQRNELRWVGRSATGEVWEQPIEVEEMTDHTVRSMRRVVVRLNTPTSEGNTEITLRNPDAFGEALALDSEKRRPLSQEPLRTATQPPVGDSSSDWPEPRRKISPVSAKTRLKHAAISR